MIYLSNVRDWLKTAEHFYVGKLDTNTVKAVRFIRERTLHRRL